MQHRGSSDSRATADSHCEVQGSRNEMEMSRQRSSRDVLLIWLVELQERVKRVDSFVRDRSELDAGPFEEKNFFLTMLHVRTQNPAGKSSMSVRVLYPLSQSIGRGRVSREGALDVRESRERRDKVFA